MKNITVGDLLVVLACVSTTITQLKVLKTAYKEKKEDTFKPIYDTMEESHKKIYEKIDESNKKVQDRLDYIDESSCKNFLVNYMEEIENGKEVGKEKTMRAFETYEHYSNDLHKNSYIHAKWESLLPKISEQLSKEGD